MDKALELKWARPIYKDGAAHFALWVQTKFTFQDGNVIVHGVTFENNVLTL